MWKEFKKFALRGNAFDLAIAVIVGAAFNKIVNSLVSDIMMPIVGVLAGGTDFKKLILPIGDVVIRYGAFIQASLDFFIITFSIFMSIKVFNHLSGKEGKVEVQPHPNHNVLLEIRDILEDNKSLQNNFKSNSHINAKQQNIIKLNINKK